MVEARERMTVGWSIGVLFLSADSGVRVDHQGPAPHGRVHEGSDTINVDWFKTESRTATLLKPSGTE